MNRQTLAALGLSVTLLTAVAAAAENDRWTLDSTLYLFAAGMSGDVTVKGIPADLDVGFGDVMSNLEFGAMGGLRAARGDWAFNLDVIYTGLGASKGPVSGDLDQWVVEPTLSYRVCQNFEPFAGVRYNNLQAEIRGPFGTARSGTQAWFDPIVGANFTFPLGKKLSLKARADVGGFGVGSDLTWQAFPCLNWRLSERCSLQAGYRWVYNDYTDGSGANRFAYDVLTQGPQLGFTIRL